jgi:hypothetical protein
MAFCAPQHITVAPIKRFFRGVAPFPLYEKKPKAGKENSLNADVESGLGRRPVQDARDLVHIGHHFG